jgi:DoxX-like family
MTVAFWVIAGLTALMYLAAGIMKLARSKSALLAAGMGWTQNVPEFGIKLIGLAEVLGALGLVLPIATGILRPLSPIAGACLAALMAGAVVVHHRRNESVAFQVALTVLTLVATAFAVLTISG